MTSHHQWVTLAVIIMMIALSLADENTHRVSMANLKYN